MEPEEDNVKSEIIICPVSVCRMAEKEWEKMITLNIDREIISVYFAGPILRLFFGALKENVNPSG